MTIIHNLNDTDIEPCEESKTIEPARDGRGYWVIQHGEYPESSVLAGQYRRVALQWYETADLAHEDYPEAKVIDHNTGDPFGGPVVPDVPPPWFDELNAGERWEAD